MLYLALQLSVIDRDEIICMFAAMIVFQGRSWVRIDDVSRGLFEHSQRSNIVWVM